MRQFPPGMIGLPCGEHGRWSDFTTTIVGLQKPNGTQYKKESGLGPARPLNTIGEVFMKQEQAQWLFLVNDDHIYPADTLMRLLARMYPERGRGVELGGDIDVVTGLYLTRFQPFKPVAFTEVYEKDGENWYERLYLTEQRGLHTIKACGDGCLLIHRTVMESIDYPWWEYGETYPDACDHDMVFSRKIREAGYLLWIDLDAPVDHIASIVVRPTVMQDGKWGTHLLQAQNNRGILVPAATPKEEVEV